MKKFLLAIVIVIGLLAYQEAQAQLTCSPVTTSSQNCLVTVTWTASLVDATHLAPTGYIIRRSDAGGSKNQIGTTVAPVVSFQNTFTDTGGVAHCWDAIATLVTGTTTIQSAPSQQACWTSPVIANMPPNAPGTPTLSSIKKDSITISWADNSVNEDGFAVIRKHSYDVEKVLLAQPNQKSVTDTGLATYTSYRYQVASFNKDGFSKPSAEVSGKTLRR